MCFHRLRALIEPPEQAVERPRGAAWADFEQKWCRLPNDFKEFVTEYGSGCIDDFLWVFNPASSNENLNLSTQVTRQLTALGEVPIVGLDLGSDRRYILPFGITDNGDVLAWKVSTDRREWHVVVIDSRAPKYEEFTMGFAEFLCALLGKDIKCTLFPKDFPTDHHWFVPAV